MAGLRHPDWHLFAERRFRRRAAVSASAQVFRGEPYIVLSDRITGQHVRLSARAQDLWRMLDGRRTAQALWEEMIRRPATAPTQTELVDWLLQLVSSGLVLSDHEIDAESLTERDTRRRSQQIESRAASPLSIKVRLFDPEPLVRAVWPFVAWLFTPFGGVLVAALLLSGLVLGLMHLPELTQGADQALLSQSRLIGVALTYPVMKFFHEMAHCLALYRFGGKVRECGVMFLVFFPVPYVEASEANALPDKRARMLVGGAGILAELVMASLALILWLSLEPGLERAILFNFILLGTVSTLLFNGNPLLKFDAYYVLSDWLELPNLASRAGAFLQDRFLWRICGLRPELDVSRSEARIFALYGTGALAYRMLLTLTIAFVVANWFFLLGLLLAAWAVVMGLLWPPYKTLRKGWRMARSQNRQRRAGGRFLLFIAVVVGLAGFVPLPFSARGEGQVTLLPAAQVTAGTTARVAAFRVADGAQVAAGDEILRLEDPEALARREALTLSLAYLSEALTRAGLAPLERQRLEREHQITAEALERAGERVAALSVTAPRAGRLAWDGARAPLEGAFLFRGDRLGEVQAGDAIELPMAFPASYSGRARDSQRVDLLFPDGAQMSLPVLRDSVVDSGGQVPEALLAPAGGPLPASPGGEGRVLIASWILWATPEGDLSARAGMRFDARVDLGRATAAEQLLFHLRRLFVRVIRL
ncbi:peptidase M50 [Oceanicola sp. S124]|uniref:peptidase M50 n=1 Tax=Oceanicola sp. S124 TaxID=1042378 RepID=UPI00025596E8|nr:peptidase M50 [Oceanicola sp. S124]